LDKMHITNKDKRDVLTNTNGGDDQSLSQVSRAETNQLRKADILPIMAPKNNSDKSVKEDFKRAAANTVRRGRGLAAVERPAAVRKRINDTSIKNYEDMLKNCREKVASDNVFENEAEDYNVSKKANIAAARAGERRGSFGSAAFMIADELKSLADNMKAKSKEITALTKLSKGEADKFEEYPENFKRETKAFAVASAQELRVKRDRDAANFNALNKVMSAVAGDEPLNLSASEEAYVKNVFSKKNLNYADFVNQLGNKGVNSSSFDFGKKIITFDKAEGINSLDDWRNADDRTLAAAFDNMFTPSKKDMDNLNRAGFENNYETIYINGVLMSDYYAQNPLEEGKDRRADVMRKILNREAQIDVLRCGDDLKPTVSTVLAESRFPPKTVTTGRIFKKTVTIDENKMFKDYNKENSIYSSQERMQIREKAMDVISPETLVRMSKRNVAENLEQRFNENMRIAENEIREQFNLQEGTVDPVEYQLFMISQGMDMRDALYGDEDTDFSKETKNSLREYWYSLKTDPDKADEYNKELVNMKRTLANAALHGGDLGENDNIIGNLDQITWLNKAAKVFTADNGLGKGLGSENDNNTINKILNITNAQLGIVDYIKSPDYIVDKPFNMKKHKDVMLNKLYLEGCNAEISGRMYSLINDSESSKVYDNKLEYNETQIYSIGPKISAWLGDKGGRNVHLSIDEEGPYLGFTAEPLDPKKVNVRGNSAKPVPEIKSVEEKYIQKAEEFGEDIKDGLRMMGRHIDKEVELKAKETARLATEDFLKVNALKTARDTVKDVVDKQDEGIKTVLNSFGRVVDEYKEVVEIRASADVLAEENYENEARGKFNAFPEFSTEQYEYIENRVEAANKEKNKKEEEMEAQKEDAIKEYSYIAVDKIRKEPMFAERERLLGLYDNNKWTLTRNSASAKVKDILTKVEAENNEISKIKSEADLDTYLKNHPTLKKAYEANRD
ncbi:MAG: hypothetical protein LUD81_11190, partial [Clostridiales bacterium]|nr:hypothetical protein [Clostridiales bacterium]